jgi:adenine specific DNA methylase Mod
MIPQPTEEIPIDKLNLQSPNLVNTNIEKLAILFPYCITETAGRYHSDWLSMIYPRLKLAKNLLSTDGVLFMSIGEEELSNSIQLLNELFGERNKISIVTRVAKTASNLGTHFAPSTDFLLCYAREIESLPRKTCDRIRSIL